MIDPVRWKVGEPGARGGECWSVILVRIADDGVVSRHKDRDPPGDAKGELR